MREPAVAMARGTADVMALAVVCPGRQLPGWHAQLLQSKLHTRHTDPNSLALSLTFSACLSLLLSLSASLCFSLSLSLPLSLLILAHEGRSIA